MYCAPEVSRCFENLISLRGTCNDRSPSSGIWLDQLGVTVQELNQYLTKDYKDAEALFLTKKRFAITNVTNAIHTFLQPRYKAHSVVSSTRVGQPKDDKIFVLGGTNELKGINFEFCNQDSFLDLYVSQINLFTDFTGTVNVYVYNLITEQLLDTIEVECTAGEISTEFVDVTYKSDRKRLNLLFCYDSTSVNSYKTVIGSSCTDCAVQSGIFQNQYTIIRGAKIGTAESKLRKNLAKLGETGGMSIDYNISCNHEDYLCNLSNMIALPVAYQTAFEIMAHAINNASNFRTNTTVTINSDTLKEKRDFFEKQFNKSIKNVLSNVIMPQDTKCFVCHEQSAHKIVVP